MCVRLSLYLSLITTINIIYGFNEESHIVFMLVPLKKQLPLEIDECQ